jgi:hypothetical protein
MWQTLGNWVSVPRAIAQTRNARRPLTP